MIKVTLAVEEAVMRFKDDVPLWIKDKTGKEADPWQIIAMQEIKENPFSMMNWPPRFGKTWAMEAVDLNETATNIGERCLIIAPAQNQANNALEEQLNFIEMSPILSKWIAFKRGKRQISETKYEFVNRSSAQTFGIRSNIDSEDASILRGEEFDDIDLERWNSRVIQRGGRKNISGLPLRIRLSGTIQWGKGPIFIYDYNDNYKTITKFDIYDGIAFGIYDEKAIAEAKDQCTIDEWLRIYLLKYTEAKNFIWESSLRKCLQESIMMNWVGIEYQPGNEYHPHGTVYMGYDCGHSGMGKVHSVYRIDIIEILGDRALWLNGKEWESTTDPDIIANDICDWWQYYHVSGGYGDALKANDIAMINDMLFDRGLVDIDRSEYPENKPANWDKWAFSPKWNSGKAKYLWGGITKVKIDNQKLIIPYFSDKDDRHISRMAKRLRQALVNIRMVINNTSYPSLEIIKNEIGDDPFDSINMANGCANDRALIPIDYKQLQVQGNKTVTADLATSMIDQIERSRESFDTFIN